MIKLNLRPSLPEWKKISFIVPTDMERLCKLCYDFIEEMDHIYSIAPVVTTELGDMITIIQEIISEYKRIMATLIIEKDLERLDNDIKTLLGAFISSSGTTTIFVKFADQMHEAQKRGHSELFLSDLLPTFESFINSRIYSPLCTAIRGNEPKLLENFIEASANNAGIYPTEYRPTPKQISDISEAISSKRRSDGK